MYFVHEGGSGGGEVSLRTHQAAAGAQVCFFLMLSPFLLLIGRVPSTVRWPRGRQAGSRRESVGNTGGERRRRRGEGHIRSLLRSRREQRRRSVSGRGNAVP